jgi:hypothetical protein
MYSFRLYPLQFKWRTLAVDPPGRNEPPIPVSDFVFDENAALAIEAIKQRGR